MTDNLTPEQRRFTMQRVRSRNTSPEIIVRRLLHRAGFRFRLHRRDLPGCPDIVLPKYRTVIFVHGCFWHRHPGCPRGRSTPASNTDYWQRKFRRNVERDAAHRAALQRLGWRVLIVWECQVRDLESLKQTLFPAITTRTKPAESGGLLKQVAEPSPSYRT